MDAVRAMSVPDRVSVAPDVASNAAIVTGVSHLVEAAKVVGEGTDRSRHVVAVTSHRLAIDGRRGRVVM